MSDARKEYADIIDREHHVSKKRQPMARLNRAAQFAPFAALTGYDDLIRESERETDEQLDLDEDSKAALNEKLIWLFHQEIPPEAAFTYFVPDSKKAGGEYITVTGKISKYDEFSQSITLEGGKVLFIEDINKIECDAFDELMW